MPLEWNPIEIPAVGGIDQLIDDIVKPTSVAQDIVNYKPNGLAKLDRRHGFHEIEDNLNYQAAAYPLRPSLMSETEIKSIFSSGHSLGVVTKDGLFIRETINGENGDGWLERGMPPPGKLDTRVLDGAVGSTGIGDVCVVGNYIVEAWQQAQRDTLGALKDPRVWVKITHKDGTVFIPPTDIGAKTLSPRVEAVDSGNALICWMEYTSLEGKTLATIKGKTWAVGDSALSSTRTYDTDARIPSAREYGRHFDMVSLEDGTHFIFTYIQHTADDVKTTRWDIYTPTQTHTAVVSTETDYNCTSIARDPTSSGFVTIAYGYPGATNEGVTCSRYAEADLTGSSTLTVFTTSGSSGSVVYTVGIGYTEGPTTSGNMYTVAATFLDDNAAGDDSNTLTKYVTFDTNLTGVYGTVKELYNTSMIIQPFSVNKRTYLGINSDQTETGFSSHALIDINAFDVDELNEPFLAASWNIGRSGQDDGIPNVIANNYLNTAMTVHIDTDDKVYFSVCTVEDAYGTSFDQRVQAQLCILDFNAKVRPVKVVEGGCLIPASVTSWFDGVTVTELGWTSPPYLSKVSNLSGGSNTGTFSVIGIWHYVDALGLIHRSPPSNAKSSGSVTSRSIDPFYFSNSATSRNGELVGDYPTDVTILSYISDSNDSKFRLASDPNAVIGNPYRVDIDTAEKIDNIPAAGSRGPVIYTQDFADFETINPGASFCAAVVRNRATLAGFHDKDRIKYSDEISTIDGNKYAPEFFDLFAFESHTSREIYALEEMDDKIVAFTEDAIFMVAGDGPDKAGRGNNYSGIVEISNEYGTTNKSSVVKFPGGIFFEGKQGLCWLKASAGGMNVEYVGNVKTEFESLTCVAATHFAAERMVIFTMSGNAKPEFVCYSYDVDMWYTWEVSSSVMGNPVDACVHNDVFYVASASNVMYYNTASYWDNSIGSGNAEITTKFATPWIKPKTTSGWIKTRYLMPILRNNGEDAALSIRVYLNYSDTVFQTIPFTNATIGNFDYSNLVDPKIHFVERCRAYRYEITDEPDSLSTGQGYSIVAANSEIALMPGMFKFNPNHRG